MFRVLTAALVLAFSASTFANDGGIAHINVKGINPVNNAGDGTTITFYGKDAANFMRLLPAQSSVVYSMVDSKTAEQLRDSQRGVALASNGWTLSFSCSGGELDSYDNLETAKFISKQAECTIYLAKGGELDALGDTWPMPVKDYEENMCAE